MLGEVAVDATNVGVEFNGSPVKSKPVPEDCATVNFGMPAKCEAADVFPDGSDLAIGS